MTRRISIGVVAAALSADARAAAILSSQGGFGGLQWDAVAPELDLTTLSQSGRRDFRQMLAQQNQQLIGLRGVARLAAGADLEKLLRRLDRLLETAAGLQSPLVCLDAGAPPPEFAALLVELGRRADRHGTTLALRSDLCPIAAITDALRAADCPWIGVDLDPAALLLESPGAEQTISQFGDLIRHVRGRDALLGLDRRTQATPMGQGSTDWRRLLTLLDETGYQGWITIDPLDLNDRRSGAAAGLKYLRGLIEPAK